MKRNTGIFLGVLLFSFAGLISTSFEKKQVSVKSSVSELPDPSDQQSVDEESKSKVFSAFGKLPLHFVENRGQLDRAVVYYAKSEGISVFCTAQGLVFRNRVFPKNSVSLKFSEKRCVKPEARNKLPGKVNYFTKNDPALWQTGIPTFSEVVYRKVNPGIDLVYSGNQRRLKYTFYLQPNAEPDEIQMIYEGIEGLSIDDATGELVIRTEWGGMRDDAPTAYQEIDGLRKKVKISFRLIGDKRVGFALGDYDANSILVIDPGYSLEYSTFLGGNAYDYGNGIAVDSSGNAYVTGHTQSTNFPTQNPFDSSHNGSVDVFVTKLSSSGNSIIYSTYIGGSSSDAGSNIAVDSLGNAYLTGYTQSSDFPTQGPFQGSFGGGSYDAFVVCFGSPEVGDVYINEIMYNPHFAYLGEEDQFCQYIELINNGDAPVTLDGWSISGVIDYTFPNGVTITPGAYLVIARDMDFFEEAYGRLDNVVGTFNDALPTSGTLNLINVAGKLVDRATYSNASPYPTEPDGTGPSLELITPSLDNNLATSWRASTGTGTPGSVNGVVPQIAVEPDVLEFGIVYVYIKSRFTLTFSNAGVSNLEISNIASAYPDMQFNKTSVTIPAGGSDAVEVIVKPTSAGTIEGEIRFNTNVPGLATGFPIAFEGESKAITTIVLNEIMYNPAVGPTISAAERVSLLESEGKIEITGTSGGEYLELYNCAPVTVDLSDWTFVGIDYAIPSGTELAPGEYLVIAKNVGYIKTTYGVENVIGDYVGLLSNAGETVEIRNELGTVIDAVTYSSGSPWPNADGNGSALALKVSESDNSLPESWEAQEPTPGTANGGDNPNIVVEPTLFNFGKVAVGSSKELDLTVSNEGDATLSVGSVSSNDERFTVSETSLKHGLLLTQSLFPTPTSSSIYATTRFPDVPRCCKTTRIHSTLRRGCHISWQQTRT